MLTIMFYHFVGDYMLQSRWMGDNKSKRLDALLLHCGVYSLFLLLAVVIEFGYYNAILFVGINFVLHLITDYFTSRLTAYLYGQKQMYETFAVMGFDQYIHFACLYVTFEILL